MPMKQLSSDTIKLISSTQIITSASSVVKELMENSIDAQSTIIDIRLENYGLDKIEIRDNGIGISHSDVQLMCLRNYTSKISSITDLEKLTCYGFRGEALSSICAVADVTVITKSKFDKYAMTFTMDSNGHVVNSSVSHHQNGTIITIVNLFKKLPVRKQYFSSKKNCINDLRRVENVVKSLAAIQQDLRVSLVHNKSVLWKMTPVNDLTIMFGQIWSSSMYKYVKQLTFSNEEVNIDMVLPMQNIDVQNCFFTTNIADAIYLYVNKRPVRDNKIEKLIVGEFSNYFGHYLPPGKYLPCFLSITVPSDTIDINLEPDKSRILFHNQDKILLNLKNCINKHYYNDTVENDQLEINTDITKTHLKNKRKSSSDSEEFITKKSTVVMSQINNSFIPNAESTKIINDNSFDSEMTKDEHSEIIEHLRLEQIDFEEPFTSNENKEDKKQNSENNDENKIDDIREYRKKLMNVTKNIPLQSIQCDNANVNNLNAENISISQWSKGDVILNGKSLKGGVSIKADISNETLERNTLHKIVKASEILQSNSLNDEPQKDELVKIDNNLSVPIEKKTTKDYIPDTTLHSSTKLAPLFRMVSIPDEQVPGLNHLVNRPQSWMPQPRSKRPIRDISEEVLSETARSVSSQMGNKEMSGFTFFAKEMRIKILKENPGMDFTKVSKELAKLWGCLSEDEKENYKKLSIERKKFPMATKANEIQSSKKSFQFIFKNLKRHSTLINIELCEIKKNIFEKPKIPSFEFSLIGQIEKNSWICCVRNKIHVVNICCLQEAVIFYQKLANDAMPLKILDQPIKTNKKYLGENNFSFLMDLATSYEPSVEKYTVKDERIIKNGFNIVIAFNDDNANPDILITDVALHISTYGAEELKQLLELMQMENKNDLSCCRPLKVINYLRSETVRYLKVTEPLETKEEINNLLNYWFKNEKAFLHNTCVHHKNVFTPIHTINN
ncbi:DNA mismatch repair protein, C-terminal,DNA mismatch repair, conserved site,High mobility group box [Cinara cedri]|uniref:DNA mismatch repair protein, C-terminal,DNA mismatch repair, conserved site,High mobility group box n=1 Tax=Cinara cedri TaxID=506608 RepID=A0A5E4MYB4_9HEMI|nr:DNA mismatch repair protein, C-terminal,DNA mismatch repair, conserved site,High mobility group box [Cinara cedri]